MRRHGVADNAWVRQKSDKIQQGAQIDGSKDVVL